MGKFREWCTRAIEAGPVPFRDALAGFAEMAAQRFGKVVEEVRIEDLGQNTNNAEFTRGEDGSVMRVYLNSETFKGQNQDDPTAAYGTVIRALAVQDGDLSVSDLVDKRLYRSEKEEQEIRDAEYYNLASLALTSSILGRINAELPGVENAVAASYLTAESTEGLAEQLAGRDLSQRFRAGWVNLVREVFGVPTEDTDYPEDGRIRDAVRESAQRFLELSPEVGKSISHASFYKQAIQPYFDALLHEEYNEESGSNQPAPNHNMETENGDAPKAETEEQAEERREKQAEREIKKAKAGLGKEGESSGTSTPEFFNEREDVTRQPIEETDFTAIIRPYLTDERIERQAGHFTGLVSQPQRVLSDFRVMSRKMILEDVPDTLMVVLIDSSGSMSGHRWTMACQIHDGVMKALSEIGVPAISATYDQREYSKDRITPVNGEGHPPIKLESAVYPGGGTGDLGAIVWATRKLDEGGRSGRVVMVISDNEGPSDPAKMPRLLKQLGARVVHVDLVGQGQSQFGVEAVVATRGTATQYAEPIALKLREALRIGEENYV